MVDAVLFELEGVLFDTITLRRDSLRSALAAHGIAIPLEPDDHRRAGTARSGGGSAEARGHVPR